jgi:hypothetical protein
LDPLNVLNGRLTVKERLKGAPSPTLLEAVRITVVGPPKTLGVPLIRPFVGFKERPGGKVPFFNAKEVAPMGSVTIW